MNTEQKARAYDEALERAKGLLEIVEEDKVEITKDDVKSLFPQLRESEDERIRKNILALVKKHTVNHERCQMEAYLEKQKDFTTVTNIQEAYRKGFDNAIEAVKQQPEKYGLQKEQKPAEYIKRNSKEWYALLSEQYDKGYWKGKAAQNPAEWSEEDADILNCCISSIEEAKENRYAYKETDGDTSYDREIAFLKSLRPSWKPSEEQMMEEAVEGEVYLYHSYNRDATAILVDIPKDKLGDKVRVIIVKEDEK